MCLVAVNLLWICDDNFQSFSIFKSQAIFLLSNDYVYIYNVCVCKIAREMAYEFPNEFQLITTRENFIYCIRTKKKINEAKFICLSCTYLCSNRLPFLTPNNDLYKFLSTNNDWKAFGEHTQKNVNSRRRHRRRRHRQRTIDDSIGWQYLIENRLELFRFFRFWKVLFFLFSAIAYFSISSYFRSFFKWVNEPKSSILQSQQKCPLIIHKNRCARFFLAIYWCVFFFFGVGSKWNQQEEIKSLKRTQVTGFGCLNKQMTLTKWKAAISNMTQKWNNNEKYDK